MTFEQLSIRMFSDIIESVKRYYPQTVDLMKWNLHNKPQLLGRRAAYFFVFGTNSLISFFLFHRLDKKADNDENRDKHYDRGDYVDDRMLLDEHRGKHDEEYQDIA